MSVLIVIKRTADRETFLADAASAGLAIDPIEGLARHFLIHNASVDDSRLTANRLIASIEDGDAQIMPADQGITIDGTLLSGSWALPRIIRRKAPWNVNRMVHPIDTFFRSDRNGAGVDIYIVDTGIDVAHADFGGRATIVYEYFSSGGAGDDVGHGTGVASAAAADVVGIARGASIFGFKIGQAPSGGSSTTALTTAIGQLLTHYAGRSNPAVCNISYIFSSGGGVAAAVASMIDAGIVVTGPAGNAVTNLSTLDVFPAEAPDAICVAGLGMADIPYYEYGVDLPTGVLTFGTNFGTSVSIMAPAQGVLLASASVLGIGSYRVGSGTSYASPMVAGVVACMLQGYEKLTSRTQVQAVKTKLLANATTGKLRSAFGLTPLPDRILYLDPGQVGPEPISGLTVATTLPALDAGAGMFTLTGYDVVMTGPIGLSADTGYFVLTGFDASLNSAGAFSSAFSNAFDNS